ncbi:MAG: hypothetical protein FWG85_02610, partial [Bacteroidetes bacterium]|nr:hypothetical protein [Bacteroidota bacterium]
NIIKEKYDVETIPHTHTMFQEQQALCQAFLILFPAIRSAFARISFCFLVGHFFKASFPSG